MYKLKDLIKMFSIPERTIRRHLRDGVLEGTKIGGSWRFDESNIRDYLGNSVIKAKVKQVVFGEVFDYLNGFGNSDSICTIHQVPIGKMNNRKIVSRITENMSSKFYFNLRQVNQKDVVTFIGSIEDAKYLMDELKSMNE